ncbi:MAG: bifunctional folylpolyglutamate synthase/dihydrofolate synthase [Ignavibacteria bacterium]|jgi:dihydrofolate synthase/folylpolyglutamate synthase|nr:bifunctional folylpolyglutamate synthase/dihydrofolate synthase [Ignavibacteria bacterium]MCU7504054.1 bifunctional folylpolyglutamate synthase/dihydrofolate synthase [Ignavibacteria bacterium]MCU7515426.1 bifunctional folylpolyglutamate synthase/dihydrofolate synthase [Ignavibacteria bacterium]
MSNNEIKEALDRLYSLQKFGIKLGLDNISRLLDYLGNPQNNFKSFHVAGTNGKGSTTSFISSILMESGYRTGLYTSPHFVRFNERVRVNGLEVPEEYIVEFISGINRFIDKHKPTFFEVTTALAFKYFSDEKVEFAAIETGLGGRLDATNVLNPLASVITSISLEHTEILGDTLEKIAFEKGGIIKKGGKAFLGILPAEAEGTLRNICRENGAELFCLSEYLKGEKEGLGLGTDTLVLDEIEPALFGPYQRNNAALAVLTLNRILGLNNQRHISLGLKNVVKNSGIQGRYEIFNERPRIIFDSAHNLEGITNFLSAFLREEGSYSKRTLLFGVMRDKAIKNMLEALTPHFDEIHLNSIEYDRAARLEELDIISKELGIDAYPEQDGAAFVHEFTRKGEDECLVVLGSMYVLGKIKEELLKKKKP